LRPIFRKPLWRTVYLAGLILVSLGLILSSCGIVPLSEAESAKRTQLRETELDINVKQTLLFEQAVNQSIEQTAEAKNAAQATSIPVQATISTPPALAPTTPTSTQLTETPTIIPSVPPPFDEAAFNAWMKNAKILLYEDMIARLDTFRYVKTTLDEMKLPVKDDGSAFGWLLDDLESGPKDGGQWDLIIIAAEDKGSPQADYFKMMLKAIDEGTSGILEVWYLNNTAESSAKGLLAECGIEYENNWSKIPPASLALYPLSRDNTILNEPNKISSFTNSTNYWWDPTGNIAYDIGDQVKLTPGSKATLLLGTVANINTDHGTSTVCMDGKLILQTFSSHALNFSIMSPLWENYIYHALRTRFMNLK
jgi:hypothetical protein